MSEPIDLAGMRDAARAVDVRCILEFNKESMRTRRFAAAWLFAAADEIDQLRQWKSEAITVLSGIVRADQVDGAGSEDRHRFTQVTETVTGFGVHHPPPVK